VDLSLNCYFININAEIKKGKLELRDDASYFEEKELSGEMIDYVLLPSFFNSHVHLGDSVALDPPKISLENLVGPGGYKFKILSRVESEEIIRSMNVSIRYSVASGTTSMVDFREGGIEGLKLLKRADEFKACIPMVRPLNIEEAQKMADDEYVAGFGLSSTRDHDQVFLEELREIARKKKIYFSIHAGERDDEDVTDALSLDPDFIVHMNRASVSNLKKAMDEDIPVVSCFRSNFFFGLENRDNYELLSEYHNWLIGTDNVMIANPSILSEINFASYIVKPENVLRAVYNGFKIFKQENGWILIDISHMRNSKNLIAGLARRTSLKDIVAIIDSNIIQIDLVKN